MKVFIPKKTTERTTSRAVSTENANQRSGPVRTAVPVGTLTLRR